MIGLTEYMFILKLHLPCPLFTKSYYYFTMLFKAIGPVYYPLYLSFYIQYNILINVITTRVCGKVMFSVVSVCVCVCLCVCLSVHLSVCLCFCLSVCLSVQAITFESLDIETSFLVCRYILTISR